MTSSRGYVLFASSTSSLDPACDATFNPSAVTVNHRDLPDRVQALLTALPALSTALPAASAALLAPAATLLAAAGTDGVVSPDVEPPHAVGHGVRTATVPADARRA